LIHEPIKIETYKHYRNESIKLDAFEVNVTQKPHIPNKDYSPAQQYTLENIFNTHTLLDKRYSFNCNKVELGLA